MVEFEAEQTGITLFLYAEDTPGMSLVGDPTKLRQVLLNLLTNAVKFTDENGKVDMGKIDFCSGEAENTYGIYVYYRSMTDRHDRLMNVTFVNSMNNG
jgi:C4-dicarboxylate-specific signal transduction histidine kinase